MSDVTRILNAIEQGDPHAADQLLPLVYNELRKLAAQKLAQEKPGQTLQATALVHEAYLRLVDGEKAKHWNSRGHFFAAAAEAIRRILIDQARRKEAQRRGGGQRPPPASGVDAGPWQPDRSYWCGSAALRVSLIPCESGSFCSPPSLSRSGTLAVNQVRCAQPRDSVFGFSKHQGGIDFKNVGEMARCP
jgi:hypothetical protein